MPILTTALALAEFVPAIAGWFGDDDDDETTAEQVVSVAKKLTGLDSPDDAIAKIKSDPTLQIEFQRAMNPVIIARLENQTKQLTEINTTIRAELDSNDKFKSYWRPGFGWSLLITWTLLMLAIIFVLCWVVVTNPADIGKVFTGLSNALGPISMMWGVALTILGVNISKRSQDKMVLNNVTPPQGLLKTLTTRFLGGKSG